MPPFLTEAVSVTNADAVFDHGGCLRAPVFLRNPKRLSPGHQGHQPCANPRATYPKDSLVI
jgi:hypothetical protein